MFNECLYIWKLLNFYKYNTALYEIFINEPLTQCAVSLNWWFLWIGRRVVAHESLRWKQRLIPKVVAVAYESFSWQSLSPSSNGVSHGWS